jgi:hypothetical protein
MPARISRSTCCSTSFGIGAEHPRPPMILRESRCQRPGNPHRMGAHRRLPQRVKERRPGALAFCPLGMISSLRCSDERKQLL